MTWQHRLSDIDPELRRGVCAACGEVGLHYKRHRDRWQCGEARRTERKGQNYSSPIRAALKMGGDQVEEMVRAQDGLCAICSDPITTSSPVDHCHTTLKVRGILCRSCNIGLGHFKDDPARLERAIAYLG